MSVKNTDKLCIFTDAAYMYQVKVDKIPRCKMRDKGTLIHSLCKMDNNEEGLLYISYEDLMESVLFFATASGYVKQASGIEFETGRLQVNATRLNDENDKVAGVKALTAAEVLSGNAKVILLTKDGLSLGFPLEEVNELKKNSRGVKGISLDKGDKVAYATVVDQTEEYFSFDGKKYRNCEIG